MFLLACTAENSEGKMELNCLRPEIPGQAGPGGRVLVTKPDTLFALSNYRVDGENGHQRLSSMIT